MAFKRPSVQFCPAPPEIFITPIFARGRRFFICFLFESSRSCIHLQPRDIKAGPTRLERLFYAAFIEMIDKMHCLNRDSRVLLFCQNFLIGGNQKYI
jgi:hypothetical protein